LLERHSLSSDFETAMITKLKADQGVSFTSNMERMFKDVTISSDIESSFLTWYKPVVDNQKSKLEISPIVVSSGCWPLRLNAPLECILPPPVEEMWSTFKAYYLGKYHGRKLNFLSHLGSAELRFADDMKKGISMTCSTHMMCILLLFNTADEFSYQDIQSVTNISDTYLKVALYSLCCAKYGKNLTSKILIRNSNSNTNDISTSDTFKLNHSFKCKLKVLKLRTVSNKLAAKNEEASDAQIMQDRELQCDACIVRVMKSRKTLKHNALVEDVIKQLSHRFKAQPQLIKKRIQILLDREFLARSTDDMNTYTYVA